MRGAPLELRPTRANGQPAFGCYLHSRAWGILTLTLSGEQIAEITFFSDRRWSPGSVYHARSSEKPPIGAALITGINIVAVPVDDIDEALHFFCDLLGMEKRKDLVGSDRYVGDRYVEVAPPGSVTALSPYTYYGRGPARATIGEYSRVVLRVDDVRQAHRELTAKGIVFETEPFDLHGGTFAALRDPWNNLFVLSDNADF